VEAFYLALGENDVVLIIDMPDIVSGTTLALTVSARGVVRTKTTQLLTVEEADRALAKTVDYRPPRA
jgi:uncharacterized protein with GYD domain